MIRRFIVLLVLVMGMVMISACGGASQPAAEPTAAPEATAAPQADAPAEESATEEVAPAEESEPTEETSDESATEAEELETPVVADTGLGELDSYRLRVLFSIEGTNQEGEDQSGTVDMLIEVNNTTKEQHIAFSASGPTFESEGMESFEAEMYNIEDKSYFLADMAAMGMPGAEEGAQSCISFPGEAEQEMPLDPNELVEGLEGTKLVEKGETVNGIVTDHYQIDENSKAFGDVKEVKSASGDIWIAQDGGYLVRLDAEVIGTDEADIEGTFTIQYDLTDVNMVESIELPEACENAIDPSEMMPDMEEMPDTEE